MNNYKTGANSHRKVVYDHNKRIVGSLQHEDLDVSIAPGCDIAPPMRRVCQDKQVLPCN